MPAVHAAHRKSRQYSIEDITRTLDSLRVPIRLQAIPIQSSNPLFAFACVLCGLQKVLPIFHRRHNQDTTVSLRIQIDNCNCLQAGYPHTVIKPLQQIHNSAAKLILKPLEAEHVKFLLKQLHSLSIEQRIKHSILSLLSDRH